MKLRVGWLSVVGKRDNNEDACYVDPRNRFFLVADGMGGQSAGERASSLAMEIVPKKLQQIDFEKSSPEIATKIIDDAITQANYEIMVLGELDPGFVLCFTFDEADYALLLMTRDEMRNLPHVRAFNDFIASRTADLRHMIEGRTLSR